MYEVWIAVGGVYRFVADAIEVNVDIYDDSVVISFVWKGTRFHFDNTGATSSFFEISGMYNVLTVTNGVYRFESDTVEVNIDTYEGSSVVISFVWDRTFFHFYKRPTT